MNSYESQVCAEILSDIKRNKESLLSFREKYIYIKKLLERFSKEITANEILQFPSLFSRIVFIAKRYNLPKRLEWELQKIRVDVANILNDGDIQIEESDFNRASEILVSLICFYSNSEQSEKIFNEISDKNDQGNEKLPSIYNCKLSKNKSYNRVQVVKIDTEQNLIHAISTDNESSELRIKYNVPTINDTFNKTVELLWIDAQINIIDYTIENDLYIPKIIVLEPDFLIDASALSECFQSYGQSYLHYFKRKFEQLSNSQHLLLGNLANFFLDECIYSEDLQNLNFKNTFVEAFAQKPLEFTSCDDINNIPDFKLFMGKAQSQFNNIKRVITNFKDSEIDISSSTLEPSFYCEKYGFQGRLDLFQNKKNNLKIIELKSGKIPSEPDKVAPNHAVQATIYRLIIESVFEVADRTKIETSIMYSAADKTGENLRYVPSFQKFEKEIIEIRNRIVATEFALYTGDESDVDQLIKQICCLANYGKTVPAYFSSQIQSFNTIITNLSDLERAYLYRFIRFITREIYIQKVGDENYDSYNSTASLWNSQFVDRQEVFDLISNLSIKEIDDSGNNLKILFNREQSSDFVNFREGELCILYPYTDERSSVLNNQIMKGTLFLINKEEIGLSIKYKQKDRKYFNTHKQWVIEHDRLDHSLNNMFKGLFDFARSSQKKKNLLLGIDKPQSVFDIQITDEKMSKEQREAFIIEKAIKASNYFLLVGPPGTGKTSIYARKLIEYYYNNTQGDILVIAYTNRAVDELCETINQVFKDKGFVSDYIRIGSELSCDPQFRSHLLQNKSRGIKSREELRQLIAKQRIIVGTLASIINKPEIFTLKKFQVALIDEASQILEPQIVGILPKVEKFILIGDHKQLSTITLQKNIHSKVDNELLNRIKLYDCRESFFERIFRLCKDKGWHQNYDTLIYQGRMHNDISKFVNEHFYDKILLPAQDWQSEPLIRSNKNNTEDLAIICSSKRIHFFNVENTDKNTYNDKVSYSEAKLVTAICKTVINIYKENNIHFDKNKTLGIITPFRNQIALIKHKLSETNIPELDNIMIDTVERFQGSQRDIIIFSFCMNKIYQLESLSNMNSEENVDRKLNVALTRARQQLFLVGNKNILSHNSLYKELIDSFN